MANLNTDAIIEALQNAEKNESQFKALLGSMKKLSASLESNLVELGNIIQAAESGTLEHKKAGRKAGSTGAKRGRKPKVQPE